MKTNPAAASRIASLPSKGLEVWMTWDQSAEVYELFSDRDCIGYVGCADSKPEAVQVAREWLKERTEG